MGLIYLAICYILCSPYKVEFLGESMKKIFKEYRVLIFRYILICSFVAVITVSEAFIINSFVSNAKLGNYNGFKWVLVVALVYIIIQGLGNLLSNTVCFCSCCSYNNKTYFYSVYSFFKFTYGNCTIAI